MRFAPDISCRRAVSANSPSKGSTRSARQRLPVYHWSELLHSPDILPHTDSMCKLPRKGDQLQSVDHSIEFPDHDRLWHAYGHAMGAALGLEFVMRLAIFHKKAIKIIDASGSERNKISRRRKLIENSMKGTFGPVVKEFRRLHPKLERAPNYCEAVSNAVSFRNVLAHKFLAHNLLNLRTDRGLDSIAAQCNLYLQHFQSLESFIRANAEVDWEAFEFAFNRKAKGRVDPWDHFLDPEGG